MILNTITVIYAAFQKVAISTAFPVIGNLLSLIIIIILAHTSSSSLVLLTFALSVAPVLIIFIATIILFTTKFRNLRPSLHLAKYQQIKELWSLGYKFFLIQIQVVVMFQATNFLISNISGPTEVTSYNISYRYLNVALMLYNIILGPMEKKNRVILSSFGDLFFGKTLRLLNKDIEISYIQGYVPSITMAPLFIVEHCSMN